MKHELYTVGQVAKFLGISRDTLKFYEKKGLIRPRKDDENGYRKYNDYDICDIITTNFYRKLDIEIKKIQEIRTNKSVSEIEALLEDKQQQIEAEIAYKQQLLEKIKRIQKGCCDVRNYMGKYTIKAMPPLVIKGEISDFLAYDEYDLLKKTHQEPKSSITLTDLRRIIYFDKKGVTDSRCVVVEVAEQAQAVEPTRAGELVKYDKCIYTIVEEGRAHKERDVSNEAEAFMRSIGREGNYEPLGMVYVNILLTTYDEGLESRFLEVYAPIK